MQKWEYSTLSYSIDDRLRVLVDRIDDEYVHYKKRIPLTPYLNELGDEGWEVVAGYRTRLGCFCDIFPI